MQNTPKLFNKNLVLLILCQGIFLTNNITFVAINGLVGLSLSRVAWMATLPIMGYVVGGALSTSIVARTQKRFGRQKSFQLGLLVAVLSSLICAYAAYSKNFWLLVFGTFVAEVDDEPIRYGIVRQLGTFNLLYSVFHEWIGIAKDVWQAPWRHKLSYLWREPGWSHDGSRDTSDTIRARWQARQLAEPAE